MPVYARLQTITHFPHPFFAAGAAVAAKALVSEVAAGDGSNGCRLRVFWWPRFRLPPKVARDVPRMTFANLIIVDLICWVLMSPD